MFTVQSRKFIERFTQTPTDLRLPRAAVDTINECLKVNEGLGRHRMEVFQTVDVVVHEMMAVDMEADHLNAMILMLDEALSCSEQYFQETCNGARMCARSSARTGDANLWNLWCELFKHMQPRNPFLQEARLRGLKYSFEKCAEELVRIHRNFREVLPEGELTLAAYRAVDVVLGQKKSHDKKNDLEQVLTGSQQELEKHQVAPAVLAFAQIYADQVAQAYQKGQFFLPFAVERTERCREIDARAAADPKFPGRQPLEDRRDYAKYLFSVQQNHPALDQLESISSRLARLNPPDYSQMVRFRNNMGSNRLADFHYGQFIDVLLSDECAGEFQDDLIFLLENAGTDPVSSLMGLINDVSRLEDPEMRREFYHTLASTKEDIAATIPAIIQRVYAESLKEFAARFPEKPLDEVLQGFRDTSTLSELVTEEELAKARGQYEEVLSLSAQIQPSTPEDFGARIDTLCREEDPSLVEYMALARETFRRLYGVYPYNTQIIALFLMLNRAETKKSAKGVYSQIKTGEGKSLIIPLLAGYHVLRGKRVDVVTTNDYLAERDTIMFDSFYSTFGGSSDFFSIDEHDKVDPDTGVIYSTNTSLILHYLLEGTQGHAYFDDKRMQVCIVDEADNLLLDSFAQSVRIARQSNAPKLTEAAFRYLISYVDKHGYAGSDEQIPHLREQARLDMEQQGLPLLHLVSQSDQCLRVFLRSARESRDMKPKVHYIIDNVPIEGAMPPEKRIVILDDQNTGRKMGNSQWSFGLHEFVTLRENLHLPRHQATVVEHSHHAFFRQYDELYCLSGTIGDNVDRGELQSVYELSGFDVPAHRKSLRQDSGITIHTAPVDMFRDVAETMDSTKRPVLPFCENVRESQRIHNSLKNRGTAAQLLNDVNNLSKDDQYLSEAEIIQNAGLPGERTVATIVAGRGADIPIDRASAELGGLEVILTFYPVNIRVEMQVRGRAGRQGNPGSSRISTYWEGNTFFEKLLPSERKLLQALREEFGNSSEYLTNALEWIREIKNTVSSEQQLQKCKFDEEHDRIIGALFTDIIHTARTLDTARKRKGLTSPPNIAERVADRVMDGWIPEYSGYDIAKAYSSLLCTEAADRTVAEVQEDQLLNLEPDQESRFEDAKKRMEHIYEPFSRLLSELGPEYQELIQKTMLSRAVALAVVKSDEHYVYWKSYLEKIRRSAQELCEDCRKKPKGIFSKEHR